jgi:8-oxo-dGTP diphosphatase / 2-hydroxy-dATP diphosphatase
VKKNNKLNITLMKKEILNATVCLLVKGHRVLLGFKSKKIGALCRNGYGGMVEKGETIINAAIRELEEETGKKIGNIFITTSPEFLEKVAIVDFENTKKDGASFTCRVHFFIVKKWSGQAVDTDEMTDSKFFKIDNLPFNQMMPKDSKFFPLILNGKKILAETNFESMKIKEVPYLPKD